MALTYAQLSALLDTTWRSRVEASLVAAAIAIAVDGPATPIDVRRDRLARQVLADSSGWASRFSLAVALGFTGGSDLTSVTDAQIDTRVASVFNDFV